MIRLLVSNLFCRWREWRERRAERRVGIVASVPEHLRRWR